MSFLRTILGLNNRPDETGQPQTENVGDKKTGSPLLSFIRGMAENLAIERIGQLTLREAVTRFVETRPERPFPVKGALIVQPHREGKQVVWVFLDRDNNLVRDDDGQPPGRKAICSTLDEELTTLLAGRELLIVE